MIGFLAGCGVGTVVGAGIAMLVIALCRAASCPTPEYVDGEQP